MSVPSAAAATPSAPEKTTNRTNKFFGQPIAPIDYVIAFLLFAIGLYLYVSTLAPDLLWGDSGELQVVPMAGGLAHATGYPIYLGIAKLFLHLPLGIPPYRVNLQSAVMGALTGAEVYLVAVALGVRRAFAPFAGLMLILIPLFWWQAVIAEVYTTSSAFLAGFLLFALLWGRFQNPKYLFVGGLIGGLCLGLHFTLLLSTPFIVVYLLLNKAGARDWKSAACGAGLGIAVAVIGYFILATPNPKTAQVNVIRPSVGKYGMSSSDLDSPFGRIRFEVTAREFRGGMLKTDHAHLTNGTTLYKDDLAKGVGMVGLILGLIGYVSLIFVKRREAALLISFSLVTAIFAITYAISDSDVDYIPSYVVFCVMIVFGVQQIQALLVKNSSTLANRAGSAAAGVFLLGLGIFPAVGVAFGSLQEGKITFLKGLDNAFPYPVYFPQRPHQLGEDIIGRMPDGSLLLTKWQNVYPCFYVALYEDNKPNIDIVEHLSYGTGKEGGLMAPSLIDYLQKQVASNRPVYSTGVSYSIQEKFVFEPVPGRFPLYRLYPLPVEP